MTEPTKDVRESPTATPATEATGETSAQPTSEALVDPKTESVTVTPSAEASSLPDLESASRLKDSMAVELLSAVVLVIQYLSFHLLVTVARAFTQLLGKSTFSEITERLMSTVNFTPMLCVLFVATGLHAYELSGGEPRRYNLPQYWMEAAIIVCTVAAVLLTCLHILGSLYVQTVVVHQVPTAVEVGKSQSSEAARSSKSNCALGIMSVLHSLAMVAEYAGFSVVCFGVVVMEPPADLPETVSHRTTLSTAVLCTILLSAVYFFVYLLLQVSRCLDAFATTDARQGFTEVWRVAATSVSLAPMLSALFLGARLRSQQQFVGTTSFQVAVRNPVLWAQACFFGCTFWLMFQTLLPVVASVTVSPAVKMLKRLSGFGVYCCIVAVLVSEFMIQVPFSADLYGIVVLSISYFLIHFLIWLCPSGAMQCLHSSLVVAKDASRVCPMFSLLLVGARIRIQTLMGLDKTFAVEPRCQLWMQIIAWSVVAHIAVVFLFEVSGLTTTVTTQKPTVPDYDNREVDRGSCCSGFFALLSCAPAAISYASALCLIVSLTRIS